MESDKQAQQMANKPNNTETPRQIILAETLRANHLTLNLNSNQLTLTS